MSGCGGRQTKLPEKQAGTFTVFCLTPGLTEIAFAICQPAQVPVVCATADYPAVVHTLPKIPTLPLDLESMLEMKPDLVLAEQGMHDEKTLEALEKIGLKVKRVRLRSLQDMFACCDSVGRWTGNLRQARQVMLDIRKGIQPYKYRYYGRGVRLAMFFYFNPIMGYGPDNWMDAKLRYLGIENALGNRNNPFVTMTAEELTDLPATHIAVPRDQALPPNVAYVANGRPDLQLIRLDDNLATRPSVRLAAQLKDICMALGDTLR